MRNIIIFISFILLASASFASWWFSPNEIAKRQVRALFEEFSQTVATQNREAVGGFLQKYLADDITIQLDVSMSVLGIAAGDGLLSKQQFSKDSFIPFIDNTLFSLEKYSFEMNLKELALGADGNADIQTTARADASGLNYLMGKRIATKWVLKTDCDGNATLAEQPVLNSMHCVIRLNQEPDLQDKNLSDIVSEYQKSMENK